MIAQCLDGRVALITGAGGDIGRAIARAFAAEGAAVAVADIDAEAATGTVAAIRADGNGDRAIAVGCDVARAADAEAAVGATVAAFGALHVLVNNAAVFPAKATLPEIAPEVWDRAFAVNVGGAFLMSKYALPEIARAGGGAVIHVASQMGRVGNPGQAVYCATKGALLTLAKAMALDHAGENIRVNTLSPGGIATPGMAAKWGDMATAERLWGQLRHPIGRLGRVEEVARAAVFLASDAASFMTGADLLIDGGYTAW